MKLNARDIALAVIEREATFRGWGERVKQGLLPRCESVAQQSLETHKGRGRQSVQKEKAGRAVLSFIRKVTEKPKIPRREIIEDYAYDGADDLEAADSKVELDAGVYGSTITARSKVTVSQEDDDVARGATAVPLHGTARGGYESGAVTEFRSRQRGHAPAMGTGFLAPPESAARAAIAEEVGIAPSDVPQEKVEAWQRERTPRSGELAGDFPTAIPPTKEELRRRGAQDTGTARDVREALEAKTNAILAKEETKGTSASNGVIIHGRGRYASAPSAQWVVSYGPGFVVTVKRPEQVRAWRKARDAMRFNYRYQCLRPCKFPCPCDEACNIFDIPIKVARS